MAEVANRIGWEILLTAVTNFTDKLEPLAVLLAASPSSSSL